MKQTVVKNGLILGTFALVSAGLIILTQTLTAPVVAQQQQQQLMKIIDAVIPPSLYDNDLLHNCVIVQSTDRLGRTQQQKIYRATHQGKPVAVAIQTHAPDGYNGRIDMLVSMIGENEVGGVRVLKQNETPGLGDKIELRVSNWITEFSGKKYQPSQAARWAVKKDGGQFDQFTGATITPRAVVNAVKRTADYYLHHRQALFNAPNQCGATDAK